MRTQLHMTIHNHPIVYPIDHFDANFYLFNMPLMTMNHLMGHVENAHDSVDLVIVWILIKVDHTNLQRPKI